MYSVRNTFTHNAYNCSEYINYAHHKKNKITAQMKDKNQYKLGYSEWRVFERTTTLGAKIQFAKSVLTFEK